MSLDASEEFKKMKEAINKIGFITILAVTIGYFFILFLVPIVILSIIAVSFSIPVQSEQFNLLATIVFLGYFAQDFIQLSREKFSLTMAVILIGLLAILIITKVFYNGIALFKLDDSTPSKFRRRIFPLNVIN